MNLIDSHVHIGQFGQWTFKSETLIAYMHKYDVYKAVVSNVTGCEFDTIHNPIPSQGKSAQITINEEVLTLCKHYPGKLKGLFWIRPYTEGCNEVVRDFITENSAYFSGIKIHPFCSNMVFTEENYGEYLEMCRELNLTIVLHTENDGYSNPFYVYAIAKKYPDINFVMVHMGLRTDHSKSIEYINELPNLYGDTTLVDTQNVIKAIHVCGSSKIMFGTDSPTFGVETFERYKDMLEYFRNTLPCEDAQNILYKNAQKLFKL